jgi:hypothetical protein
MLPRPAPATEAAVPNAAGASSSFERASRLGELVMTGQMPVVPIRFSATPHPRARLNAAATGRWAKEDAGLADGDWGRHLFNQGHASGCY